MGEKKAALKLWLSLDKRSYSRYHDLIVPSRNGTAQIDHLLVSRYGVFIVESKNWRGWIFGSVNEPKWTRTLYGDKTRFQNPLRQTYRQQQVLSEFLSIDPSLIRVIVYFVGNCELKSIFPSNVICSDPGGYIKRFTSTVLSEDEVRRINSVLRTHVSGSRLKTKDHLVSLRIRHQSKTKCPKCGGELVERRGYVPTRPPNGPVAQNWPGRG